MNNFIEIAKRENNTKRGFLIVNRVQAKHIPADPDETLRLFGQLSDKVQSAYPGTPPEKLLIVGFAETATAISAKVAADIGTHYIQTTREDVPGSDFLYFSEEHSHATEQRLVRSGLDRLLQNIDRVLFIDDEVTTGKTILNIINVMRREYPFPLQFSAVSLLNGMTDEHLQKYADEGIDVLYLHKLDNFDYESRVRDIPADGDYNLPTFPRQSSGRRYCTRGHFRTRGRCLTAGNTGGRARGYAPALPTNLHFPQVKALLSSARRNSCTRQYCLRRN